MCSQTHEPKELCPPHLAPGQSLQQENYLCGVFLSQSRSISENSKAHKTEMSHIKIKMVCKRLERYLEATITIICDVRYKAPANLTTATPQTHHLPLPSIAPSTHPKPCTASQADYTSLQTFHRSFPPLGPTLLGKCLLICDVHVQITFLTTLLELQAILYPASTV